MKQSLFVSLKHVSSPLVLCSVRDFVKEHPVVVIPLDLELILKAVLMLPAEAKDTQVVFWSKGLSHSEEERRKRQIELLVDRVSYPQQLLQAVRAVSRNRSHQQLSALAAQLATIENMFYQRCAAEIASFLANKRNWTQLDAQLRLLVADLEKRLFVFLFLRLSSRIYTSSRIENLSAVRFCSQIAGNAQLLLI